MCMFNLPSARQHGPAPSFLSFSLSNSLFLWPAALLEKREGIFSKIFFFFGFDLGCWVWEQTICTVCDCSHLRYTRWLVCNPKKRGCVWGRWEAHQSCFFFLHIYESLCSMSCILLCTSQAKGCYIPKGERGRELFSH